MKCLKVPKSVGEEVRKKLLHRSLLSTVHQIKAEDGHLLLPLTDDDVGMDYPIVERDLKELKQPPSSLAELIDLPTELLTELPSSYDIIGDIVVVKIPDSLKSYREDIGGSLLKLHKNANVVLEDRGVEGDFRVRNVVHLAGERRTSTVYKEHGAEFVIDLTKAYFSPRLATERMRVVEKVQPNERILDMFAGVGPYSILIARNVDVKKIYAVDINPHAVTLLGENILRNSVEDKIEVIRADARDVKVKVERVIMNLPHSAKDFLEHALESLGSDKGYIHYYEVISTEDLEYLEEGLKDQINKLGFHVKVDDIREVRTYSASKVHVAVDLEVSPL